MYYNKISIININYAAYGLKSMKIYSNYNLLSAIKTTFLV